MSEPDICRNNHGGNEESEGANRRTRKARDTARIYAHVHAMGWTGATGEEVAESLGMLHQTVSARFSEMKRDGHLIVTGQRRLTRRGRCPAAVCITRGIAASAPAPVEQQALL